LVVAFPNRKTASHFSWKRSLLVVAFPNRKTASHFSWKHRPISGRVSEPENRFALFLETL